MTARTRPPHPNRTLQIRPAKTKEQLRAAVVVINAAFAPVLNHLEQIRDVVLKAHAAAQATGEPFGLESLAEVRPLIGRILAAETDMVAGAGVVSAPGALADAPRWLEWWIATANGPQALRVTLDPRLSDFYDYTTADWYHIPEQTGASAVAGPYVDVQGTNEYTVTFSLPILVEAQFLGVAAADVYVTGLERRLLPDLAVLSFPTVLANADDRVIVTTDPRWLPGALLFAPDSTPFANTDKHLPWRLVATGADAGSDDLQRQKPTSAATEQARRR